jgi:type IV secretion/conjugal transfer VirB4 family ATPase
MSARSSITKADRLRFLSEYRAKAEHLYDHLPWAALIAPGVILNKDGAFQKTLRFRGPDLASSTDASLLAVRAQLNNALRRLGSRWCLHIEAVRSASPTYPDSRFPDPISQLVDDERRWDFAGDGRFFESRFLVTFTMLTPTETSSKVAAVLISNAPEGQGPVGMYKASLAEFTNTITQIRAILGAIMPEVEDLDDDETLTYLHGCVSTRNHWVRTPPTPAYLDAYLTDDTLTTGLYPRLGPHFLRTISIRSYPAASTPAILDGLNELPIAYRWVSRYLALDKEDADRELKRARKLWWQARKSMIAMVMEGITRQETSHLNPDAAAKAQDADEALAILGGDYASMGHFTPTITLTDVDADRLNDKVRQVEAVINRCGFVAKVEDVNAVEAWLGSIPGEAYADVRRPIVSTLNLCDMIPMSAIWPGPTHNRHLTDQCILRGHAKVRQPPLMYTRTAGSTPFRLDLHQGDVGHTMIVGPTGAGKSVLLNTLALQWLRYPEAQVFFFDKGASSRAATHLVGGDFHALGADDSDLAFQPLADLDDAESMSWAQEWVQDIVVAQGVELTPEIRSELWDALSNLASGPREQRTLTILAATIQHQQVKQALEPYTWNGAHGHLLDAQGNTTLTGRWQTFEMDQLMANKTALAPVLTYIFRAIEQRFDGRPTLLIIDEAWSFLDKTSFAAKIREWLKTLRKRNVAVVFATQGLEDISGSSIAPALIESCPTRCFLPNPDAITPRIKASYLAFGLNDQQIQLIATAYGKRDYYFQTTSGNRLIQLGLGPVGLIAAGSSSPGDQSLITDCLARHGRDGFAHAFLRAKGAPDAVLAAYRRLEAELSAQPLDQAA